MSREWVESTIGSVAIGELSEACRRSTHDGETIGTILLVEDELRVRHVMTEVLRLKGYAVLEAERAEEALQLARESEGQISLLLTDVVLPGKNGRELAREMRLRLPSLKTIFVSGYGESVALLGTNCDEGVRYLAKPFSVSSLLESVESTLSDRPLSNDYRWVAATRER